MNAAERIYQLLLRAYPREFRSAYAREMTQLFRDRRNETASSAIRFWATILADIAQSAPELRLEASRLDWAGNIHIKGGKMKTMAILAILIGAVEVVNSAAEAWAGGIVNHWGSSLAGGAMGAVAGALLVASAIALLRRTPGAAAFAQTAAIACLAVFAGVLALRPMFSIFADILGIGFPVAMLLFLRFARRHGPSAPSMA